MNNNLEIPADLDWDAVHAIRHILKLAEAHKKAVAEATVAKKPFGELQEFTKYEITAVSIQNVSKSLEGIWTYRAPVTIEHYQQMLDRDLEVLKQNQALLDNNQEIFNKIVVIYTNLGFSKEDRSKNKRNGSYPHSAWYEALNELGSGYLRCDSERALRGAFAIIKKTIDTFHEMKAETERIKQEEATTEAKRREQLAILTALASKYGLKNPYTASLIEVQEAILASDRYLYLAFYLENNRNDWSDGSSLAALGLDHFMHQSDGSAVDQEIISAIRAKLSNYDDDGRIFRDGEWGYGEILQIADAVKLADLRSLRQSFGEEY